MQIKEYRVVDASAEQIKTIDQCRLERYLGNVGSEGVKLELIMEYIYEKSGYPMQD